MFNLLAGDVQSTLYTVVNLICVIGTALLSVFIIIVVLVQPGNSSGISALGGNADTFYNRGKGKTLESKLKVLTFISLAIMAVFMLSFFIIQKVWVF